MSHQNRTFVEETLSVSIPHPSIDPARHLRPTDASTDLSPTCPDLSTDLSTNL